MKLMTRHFLRNKASRWSASRRVMRSGVPGRFWVASLGKGLMTAAGVVGFSCVAWAASSQGEVPEVWREGVTQEEITTVAVAPLTDHQLEQLRGRFVAPEVSHGDGVILWDERPGQTGQGGHRPGTSNLSTGTLNQQVTRVETQRDSRP